jgi:hypothetical protein
MVDDDAVLTYVPGAQLRQGAHDVLLAVLLYVPEVQAAHWRSLPALGEVTT